MNAAAFRTMIERETETTKAYNLAKIARGPRDQFMNVFPWFGFLCHFFVRSIFFLHTTWISLNIKVTMLFEWLIMNCCMHCHRFGLCHYCVKYSACFLIAAAFIFFFGMHEVCGSVFFFFFTSLPFSFVYNFKQKFCDA